MNPPVMLDFGNEKGDVVVEFVSAQDIPSWQEERYMRMSSYSVYDVREAATNAVAALEKRTAEKHSDHGFRWRARKEAGRVLSEKLLKAQLEGLFAYLEKRGKLPAKK